ncbi:hypothetical protein [Catenuloplanes indicus]|uniref:Uncharacterized protein n=1 Tax=Catenuloplanes indicus TaxID=137267 RepID=A0AAE3VSF9_9ACTN|nr:hypothetical protein [Catenuloplanes indicus]MDQ0363418.1 hypothetical protein [Catenuloplanes indicus]
MSAALLAGCGTAGPEPYRPEPAQPPAQLPISGAGGGESDDDSDCDAEDRARNELPDCGWTDGGRFVQWSWVRAGKTTPPAGWRADSERKVTVQTPQPVAPRATAPRSSGDEKREPAPTKTKPTTPSKRSKR